MDSKGFRQPSLLAFFKEAPKFPIPFPSQQSSQECRRTATQESPSSERALAADSLNLPCTGRFQAIFLPDEPVLKWNIATVMKRKRSARSKIVSSVKKKSPVKEELMYHERRAIFGGSMQMQDEQVPSPQTINDESCQVVIQLARSIPTANEARRDDAVNVDCALESLIGKPVNHDCSDLPRACQADSLDNNDSLLSSQTDMGNRTLPKHVINEYEDEIPYQRPQLKKGRGRRVVAPLEPVEAPISDYEQQRAENVRRNQLFLRKLGIVSNLASIERSRSSRLRGKGVNASSPPVRPLRRSSRHLETKGQEALELPDEPENEEPTFTFGNPIVGDIVEMDDNCCSYRDILGLRPLQLTFYDPKLTKIYTMHTTYTDAVQGTLLAAGGQKGQIAVFRGSSCFITSTESYGGVVHESHLKLDDSEQEEGPILSWKGSSSWISSVIFLTQNQGNATLLLSSANDGKIMLWDVNKRQTMHVSTSRSLGEVSPRLVASAGSIHTNGIFSMHEYWGKVVTGSKDSTLGCCVIRESCIEKERSVTGHHVGPIRGVNYRNAEILADAGADSLICILDLRLPHPVTITVDTLNPTGVNSVEWCSSTESILLSASKDPHLFLHDIRNPNEPLYKLSGHVNPKLSRCSYIYRPTFLAHGKVVATPGQASGHLSLYSAITGKIISRCPLGYDATMVMSNTRDACSRLWVAGKYVSQLAPVWQSDTRS